MHIEIEVLPTTQLDRLTALRAEIGLALHRAAVAYRAPFGRREANEDRCVATTTQLWDDLLVALVAAWDGPAEEMLAYVADTLELRRDVVLGGVGIPVLGKIVSDPVLGNRVVWDKSKTMNGKGQTNETERSRNQTRPREGQEGAS